MTLEEHLRIIIGDLVLKIATQATTIDLLRAELETLRKDSHGPK